MGHIVTSHKDRIQNEGRFLNDLWNLNIWYISSARNSTQRSFDLVDFLRGFIPVRLKSFLASNLSPALDRNSLDSALIDIQTNLINCYRKWVWSHRNEKLKELQNVRGISKRSLKRKYRNRDR